MKRILMSCLITVIASSGLSGVARPQEAGLAQIKERELEAVREKISVLKAGMDKRAAERDRITSELQASEVVVVEKRTRLREIERQRDFS